MPGRPTAVEHRDPFDDVRKPTDSKIADPRSLLHVLTLVAAEQQTMNFYMTIGNRPLEPIARSLYLEIAQIEEQHVTQYESLLDPNLSGHEQMVLHEYNECYLYYSFFQTESEPRLKQLWELHLNMEIEHLRIACELLAHRGKRRAEEFLPAKMPEVVTFEDNRAYVRSVLQNQVALTANGAEFVPTATLDAGHRYFAYQNAVHGQPSTGTSDQPSDLSDDTTQNKAVAQKYLELWNITDNSVANFNTASSTLFARDFKLESDTTRLLAGEQLDTEAEAPAGATPADDVAAGAPPVTPATGDAAVLMKAMDQLRTAVPDLKVTLKDVFAHEDIVVEKWTATGTFKAPLMGADPTNRSHTVTGVDIHRFLDGRIVSIYSVADTARLNRDLRNTPSQPAPVDPSADTPAAPGTDPGTVPAAPVTP